MKTHLVRQRARDAILRFDIPATLEVLAKMDAELDKFLDHSKEPVIGPTTRYNIRLAVQELCTNIVRHAYAGQQGTIRLIVTLVRNPAKAIVTSHDKGPCHFDTENWEPPTLDEPQVHGMGMWLMYQLMDEVEYRPASGDNRWSLTKYLTEEEED